MPSGCLRGRSKTKRALLHGWDVFPRLIMSMTPCATSSIGKNGAWLVWKMLIPKVGGALMTKMGWTPPDILVSCLLVADTLELLCLRPGIHGRLNPSGEVLPI